MSQTFYYIVSFNFLYSAVQKFYFGGPFWGVSPLRGPPCFARIFVSQTISYIASRNFLCSVVQKFHFESSSSWRNTNFD